MVDPPGCMVQPKWPIGRNFRWWPGGTLAERPRPRGLVARTRREAGGSRPPPCSWWLTWAVGGGDDGTRTHDPLLAKQVLFQLSYIPMLTCSFASHHASCTVTQHSNSTITTAQDWDGVGA